MRHLLPSPFRSLSVAGLVALIAQLPANAAITLTIDTISKTFTWSGSATSDSVELAKESPKIIQLGIDGWIGGIYISDDAGAPLGVSIAPPSPRHVDITPAFDTGIPTVTVNPSNPFDPTNSIRVRLGNVEYRPPFSEDPATVSASFSITGDGQAYSYATLNGNRTAYLESLDGTVLYFQDYQGGGSIVNIGTAGQIVVIPEPSSALLLIAAPFLFSLSRRRQNH